MVINWQPPPNPDKSQKLRTRHLGIEASSSMLQCKSRQTWQQIRLCLQVHCHAPHCCSHHPFPDPGPPWRVGVETSSAPLPSPAQLPLWGAAHNLHHTSLAPVRTVPLCTNLNTSFATLFRQKPFFWAGEQCDLKQRKTLETKHCNTAGMLHFSW